MAADSLLLSPQRYFPYEKKQVADEMVERIREEFKIMLQQLDWMDPEVYIQYRRWWRGSGRSSRYIYSTGDGGEDQGGVQDRAPAAGLDGSKGIYTVHEMVERIREEFKIMLEQLDWMDPAEVFQA